MFQDCGGDFVTSDDEGISIYNSFVQIFSALVARKPFKVKARSLLKKK
jgi:hypothetical protein